MPQAPVAPFSPLQNQYFSQVQGLQGSAQPYFNLGQQYLQQSAAPITGQEVASYYNPMAQNVTAQMQNIFGQQQQQNNASLAQSAGGQGASRIAVGQGNLANQQALAAGQTYSGLYQQALQAAQTQAQMQAGAGYGISQMGPAALSAQLQGTGALGTAGGQQQQQEQAMLNAPYQQQLAQIAYPFQTSQYLAGIAGGLAPAMGGTTNATQTTTYPTPSPLSQALGVGTSALGLKGAGGGLGSMFSGIGTGLGNLFGGGTTSIAGGDAASMGGDLLAFANRGGRAMAFGGDPTYGKLEDQAIRHDESGMLPQAQAGNPYDAEALQDIGGSLPMFDDGGGVDQQQQGLPFPGASVPKIGGASPIPFTSLGMGAGHSGLLGGQAVNNQYQMPYAIGPSGIIGSSPFGSSQNTIGNEASMALRFANSLGNSMGSARGGRQSEGGMVNPYDFGRGFDDGGAADDEALAFADRPQFQNGHLGWNDIQSAASNFYGNLTGNIGSKVSDAAHGIGQVIKDYGAGYNNDQTATATPAAPSAIPQPAPTNIPLTGYPSLTPSALPPATPPAQPAAPTHHIPTGGNGSVTVQTNADMPPPSSQQPYPNATKSDWGQNLVRSPWMALVKAGAAMATSTGPIGSVIGKGIAAGAGELQGQRKELRSEEDINLKAQQLSQQAQQHLDAYQRMTPAQIAMNNRMAASLAMSQERLRLSQSRFGAIPPATLARIDGEVRSDPRFIGESEDNIQAEITSRAAMLAQIHGNTGGQQSAGLTAATAQPDPGQSNRVAGHWYIGPTGKPQQWRG